MAFWRTLFKLGLSFVALVLSTAKQCPVGEKAVSSLHDSAGVWQIDDFATPTEMKELIEASFYSMAPNGILTGTGISTELNRELAWTLTNRVVSLFPDVSWEPPTSVRMRRMVSQESGAGRIATFHRDLQTVKDGYHLDQLEDGSDWHPPHTDSWDSWYAEGSGVLMSAMLYLTTSIGGGATTFPKINVSVLPKAGRLVLWRTCKDSTSVDELSMHEGSTLSSGMKWTALWLFNGDPQIHCQVPPSPISCVRLPLHVTRNTEVLALSDVPHGFSNPPGIFRDPKIGTYVDCTESLDELLHEEVQHECEEYLMNKAPFLPEDIRELFDVTWLSQSATHQAIELAYLLKNEVSLEGEKGEELRKLVHEFNRSHVWKRDDILDQIRRNSNSRESYDDLTIILPSHAMWSGLMFRRIHETAEKIRDPSQEMTDEERELQKTVSGQGLLSGFKAAHLFENNLHRLTHARVVVADYQGLLAAIGAERLCGQQRDCSKESMDNWLLQNAGYIGQSLYSSVSELTPGRIPAEPVPAKVLAVRPPFYGRAVQIVSSCCEGDRLSVERNDTHHQDIEVKGVGVHEFQAYSRGLFSQFGSGTYSLAEALREYTIYQMLSNVESTESEANPQNQAAFSLVPVYAVIDTGFSVPAFDDNEATETNTRDDEDEKLTHAALLVRAAHARPIDCEIESDPRGYEIENVTSRYGLGTRSWHFPEFASKMRTKGLEIMNFTNIQMDLHQRRIVDLGEWVIGSFTDAAAQAGLPKELFMTKNDWQHCVDVLDEAVKNHMETSETQPDSDKVLFGQGPLGLWELYGDAYMSFWGPASEFYHCLPRSGPLYKMVIDAVKSVHENGGKDWDSLALAKVLKSMERRHKVEL